MSLKGRNIRTATAILVLSVMQNHLNMASPAMSQISKAFPQYSASFLALVLTIACIGSVPATLMAGLFAKRFGEKTIALFGFFLLTVTGVASFFAPDFRVLLALRFLTGFGVGIVSPFQTSLIPNFFEGYAASFLFGLQCVILSAFGMIYGYLGGLLSIAGWNYNFLIYLLGIPAFAIIAFWLPKTPVRRSEEAAEKFHPQRAFVFLFALVLLYSLCNFTFTLNISYYISAGRMGNSVQAGLCIAVYSIGAMMSGLLYGKAHQRAPGILVPFGMALGAVGCLLLVVAQNIVLPLIASLLLGLANGFVMPSCLRIVMRIYPGRTGSFATGILLGALYLATFASPYLALLFGAFSPDEKYRLIFLLIFLLMLLISAATYVLNRKKGYYT